jgi:hypothetical protein
MKVTHQTDHQRIARHLNPILARSSFMTRGCHIRIIRN